MDRSLELKIVTTIIFMARPYQPVRQLNCVVGISICSMTCGRKKIGKQMVESEDERYFAWLEDWLFSSREREQLIKGKVIINGIASQYEDLGGEWKQ